ncbi:hypothetical protein R3P38DRAFT_3298891 [Favolaschia claudopus]|uniref:Uncharacterized protein n=1 Tax=Favolaschia claudopus TaxID=2862362 RepID=A0AAV9Z208_9AGAR
MGVGQGSRASHLFLSHFKFSSWSCAPGWVFLGFISSLPKAPERLATFFKIIKPSSFLPFRVASLAHLPAAEGELSVLDRDAKRIRRILRRLSISSTYLASHIFLLPHHLRGDLSLLSFVGARAQACRGSAPFASQLINALRADARVASITGKWSNSRIVVAVSRKLRSVNTVGYDGITSGYRVLGTYNEVEVVGDGTASGIGGPKDDTVARVLAPTAQEQQELDAFRDLYNVPPSAEVYSVFFIKTDQENHNERIIRVATSNSAARQPSSDHRGSTTPIAYVESQFPDIVSLFRAVDTSSLGAAYKANARVRLIRDLWERLGMEWPNYGQ